MPHRRPRSNLVTHDTTCNLTHNSRKLGGKQPGKPSNTWIDSDYREAQKLPYGVKLYSLRQYLHNGFRKSPHDDPAYETLFT
jgi:hypothetical protein